MAEKKKYTGYKKQYSAANYDQLRVLVPKGRKADVEAHARSEGQSINGFVNGLLRDALGVSDADWAQTERKKKKGVRSDEVLDDQA